MWPFVVALIRSLLKSALWVSCLRSTARGCRALGLATPGRAELDGPAPSPLLILPCSSGDPAPAAVGSASCLLHLPLCAYCQPLGLPLMLSGSSGLLPAILQPHHSTLWRRTSSCSHGSLLLLLCSCLHLPTLLLMRVCKLQSLTARCLSL